MDDIDINHLDNNHNIYDDVNTNNYLRQDG